MKNLRSPSGIAIHLLTDSEAVINIISDIRLMDGGAAMLAHVNMNHHIVSTGTLAIRPFDRVRLRVCVNS